MAGIPRYVINREQVDRDAYERQKLMDVYEARWPKWIKYVGKIVWIVCAIAGFFIFSAFGAMIGFIVGGSFSMLFEIVARKIVGKKLGIRDDDWKEEMDELIKKQNLEMKEREAEAVRAANEEAIAQMKENEKKD